MKKRLSFFFLIVFLFAYSQRALPWDNESTHRDISSYAAESSILSKSDYLRNLGFEKGLDEILVWNGDGWDARKWLREGAYHEDDGSSWNAIRGKARYNNHFHNPLETWTDAGLSDLQSGESSVLWAQDTVEQDGSVGGDWSWLKVRYCFYDALTAETESERQAFFACTFEGLGYQMHLIQDMSVPAHVRNDAHPGDAILGTNYETLDPYLETWAKTNRGIIDSFALYPTFPEVSLEISRNGLTPITQFIDSEQYFGSTPSTSLTWGLAEYTNSNFVSDDTIFTEDRDIDDTHYFPYPRYSANHYAIYEVPNSLMTKRIYLKKDGEGEHIEHFATAGPLFKLLSFDPVLQKSDLKLDPVVFQDYAEKLIPRAVGYSAALINYFFRGDIDMIPDDAKGSGFVIVNNTDEDIYGTFELWYDNENDERVKAWNDSFGIGKKSSSNNKSTNIIFTAPNDAKKPDKYMLVFKGEMGSEDNAVAGKMVELASEYLFLVSAWPHNIQTYRIGTSSGSYQLTPVQKAVNIRYSSNHGIWGRNLTIQSDPQEMQHYAVLPFVTVASDGKNIYQSYSGSISNYGIGVADFCYWDGWYGYRCDYAYHGSPSYYRPEDFTGGSTYVLANNGLKRDNSVFPRPVASGRKPFKVIDGVLLEDDISVWQDQDSCFIQYRDQSGNWIRGSDLPAQGSSVSTLSGHYFQDNGFNRYPSVIETSVSNAYALSPDHIAIVSEDKTLNLKSDTNYTENDHVTGPTGIYPRPMFGSTENILYYSGFKEDNFSQKSVLRIGNMAIDDFELSMDSQAKYITYTFAYLDNTSTQPLEDTTVYYENTKSGKTFWRIIDYDSDDSGNKLIVFYSYDDVSEDESAAGNYIFTDYYEWTDYKLYRTKTTRYRMAYSIDGNVKIIDIAPYFITTYPDNGIYGEVNGQAISGVSCQISKNQAVYTYIVEDSASNWGFNKRIVGIINMADDSLPVGYRQEFELYLPEVNFDPSDLAAIGVTR